MSTQVEMVSLNELVSQGHQYRKFVQAFDFNEIYPMLAKVQSDNNYQGYTLKRLFLCLLLQFMEDVSDRELERMIQENTAAKWFCGFGLSEQTPDFTVFSRARGRIGTQLLSEIFTILRKQLKKKGYMSEVFTFVDASHLVSKANLWQERDEAIANKYEQLSNENIGYFAHDKQAKIGCTAKQSTDCLHFNSSNKYWYGYKKHASVDMQSGMINKVAVTPANVTDNKGFKHVCPSSGAAYCDKGYPLEDAKKAAARRGVALRAIKKNNMKDKNHDLDRWISKIRAPYERVFSKQNHRVRYVGIAKNQFAEFMKAICHNMKRILVLETPAKPSFAG
jgi:transposase, IS5 family